MRGGACGILERVGEVLLRTHPDYVAGRYRLFVSEESPDGYRLHVHDVDNDVHAISVLDGRAYLLMSKQKEALAGAVREDIDSMMVKIAMRLRGEPCIYDLARLKRGRKLRRVVLVDRDNRTLRLQGDKRLLQWSDVVLA